MTILLLLLQLFLVFVVGDGERYGREASVAFILENGGRY